MKRYTVVKIAMASVTALLILALLAGIGAFNNRPPTVTRHFELNYDDDKIATQALLNGEAAGSIAVTVIVPYSSVVVSWANPRAVDVVYQPSCW